MSETEQQDEVKRNYTAFMQQLPVLLESYAGKFALMHQAKIVDFFDSPGDAWLVGVRLYGDRFSVQEVVDAPVDLGFYSHVVH